MQCLLSRQAKLALSCIRRTVAAPAELWVAADKAWTTRLWVAAKRDLHQPACEAVLSSCCYPA